MFLKGIPVGLIIAYMLAAPAGVLSARAVGAEDGEPADKPSFIPPMSRAYSQPTSTSWQYGKHSFRFRPTPGSEYRLKSHDVLEITAGEILVEPTRQAVIVTPHAETYVKRRAVMLFRVQAGSTRCMVLWDAGSGSVSVVRNRHHARLGPGDEALVCDHDPNPREIYEADEVGRRRIKVHEVGAGSAITTAEFSLLQALERIPLLYEVFRSPDAPDKAIKEKILKTAAVLNMVTYGHGTYSSGIRF